MRGLRRILWGLVLGAFASGCVTPIEKRRINHGRPHVVRNDLGPNTISLRPQVRQAKSGDWVLVVRSAPECLDEVVTTTPRTEVIERTSETSPWVMPVVGGGIGASAAGLGVILLVNSPNPTAPPQDAAGLTPWLLIGGGAGMALLSIVVGIVNGARLADTEIELAPEVERTVEARECAALPFVSRPIEFIVSGKVIHGGTTNERGLLKLPREVIERWDQLEKPATVREVDGSSAGEVKIPEPLSWERGKQLDSAAGYAQYLRLHPDGPNAAEAMVLRDTRRAREAETERRVKGLASLAEVRTRLDKDELLEARVVLARASGYGMSDATLESEVSRRIAARGASELAAAWKAVRANKPDEAREAQARAEAYGATDDKLDGAIEATPAVRAVAAEEARKEREKKLEAQRQEARVQAAQRKRDAAALQKARALAGRCTKVLRAREQIDRLMLCEGECRTIRKRVEQDWARLESEAIDLDGVSDEQAEVVREICANAGCPSCSGAY